MKHTRCRYCLAMPSPVLGKYPCSCSESGSHRIESPVLLVVKNPRGTIWEFDGQSSRRLLASGWTYTGKSIPNPRYR